VKYAVTAALLLLSVAGSPILAQSKDPSFEVASVKVHDAPTPPLARIEFGRDGLTLREIDLSIGLTLAYGVRNYQIQGPDWLHFGGKFFDVVAKASGPVSRDQLRLMLRALLAERFHLTFHREQKEMPVIALLVAKGGPKLHASAPGTEIDSQWIGFDNMLQVPGPTGHMFTNTPMSALAMAVSASLGGGADPVVDMTGLQRRYDFFLRDAPRPLVDDPPQTPDDRFALNKAIVQDDLGLTLQRRKAPIEMFIVDHADKVPIEN
jgi:uncharacterized protein (TIGR03435 family)